MLVTLMFFSTSLTACKKENDIDAYNYCINAIQKNGYEIPPEDEDLKIWDSDTKRYVLFYYIPQTKNGENDLLRVLYIIEKDNLDNPEVEQLVINFDEKESPDYKKYLELLDGLGSYGQVYNTFDE